MKQVIVTIPFPQERKAELEGQLPGGRFIYCPPAQITDEMLAQTNILLGNVPPARVPLAPQLEWMQLNSSGSDAFVKPGVLPVGAKLTNSTGAYGLAISEHLLAATLFLKKKLGLYHRNQQKALWQDEGPVSAIQGSTTLVIGLGNIGGDYARKMAALGSHVYGIRRNQAPCPDHLEAVGTFAQLDEWLPKADIVALALPNSPETYRLFDEARMARMKPGSILLNVGRGSCIDQDALLNALRNGPLMGASIDVTDPEPLPAESPLWQCENLLITPHISGEYHLQETLDHIVELFIENLGRYVRGEELRNPVDFQTGYRKSAL